MLNVNIKESDWPDGAEWVTQDKNGRIDFWIEKPEAAEVTWISGMGDRVGTVKNSLNNEPNESWRNAIMKRPQAQANKQPNDQVTSLSVLQEVSRIQVDRGAIYEGQEQERSMAKIVAIFNLHHNTELTESQGWHFMEILKNVRLFNAPEYHHDSGVDGVSYAALKVEAKAKE